MEGKDEGSGVEGSSKEPTAKQRRSKRRPPVDYWKQVYEESPPGAVGRALWSEEEQRARIRKGDPEWELAWRRLVSITGDLDFEARHPLSGRCWGYLGSDAWPPPDVKSEQLRFKHVFRHRQHPRTGCWHEVEIDASEGWPYSEGGADGPKQAL